MIGSGKNMSYASRYSARWRNNPFYKWHKSKKKKRNEDISYELNEIKVDSVDLSFDGHDVLNPRIWNEDKTLKDDIREDLIAIAHEFYKTLKIDVPIEGIILVGSSANYNYTVQSDVDLHLIIDFSKIKSDTELVRDYFDIKKLAWGLTHDIKIKEHDVEVYVQNVGEMPDSAGIFDLVNNKWISVPKREEHKIDKESIRKKVDYLSTLIDDLEDIKDDSERIEASDIVKEKIKKMRKTSLVKGGEFDSGNLAFKVLRNLGYLEKLSKIKDEAIDHEYTIDEENMLKENALAPTERQRNFFGVVDALQQGEMRPSKAGEDARRAASEVSQEDVEDFINTPDEYLRPPIPRPSEEEDPKRAVSKRQRNFFGIVDDLQQGNIRPSKAGEDARRAASDEIPQNVKDFMETPDKYLIEDHDTDIYDYCCLMLQAHIYTWKSKILSKIDKGDIYPDLGFEQEPHVTVLCGLKKGTDLQDVIDVVSEHVKNPIAFQLTNISVFEDETHDVLKLDVYSPELVKLNAILRDRFDYVSDFEGYNPHMTIAYLKKGTAHKYITDLDPVILKSSTFKYSEPNGDVFLFNPLNQNRKMTMKFSCDNGLNRIHVVRGDINMKKMSYLKDFVRFACDNLKIEKPVDISYRNGRDEYIGSTASYIPSDNTNHVNINNRSLVDIMRSTAHELTHNRQREVGKFQTAEEVQNIGGEIENEADSVAGMLIKHYTHTNGLDEIYDL